MSVVLKAAWEYFFPYNLQGAYRGQNYNKTDRFPPFGHIPISPGVAWLHWITRRRHGSKSSPVTCWLIQIGNDNSPFHSSSCPVARALTCTLPWQFEGLVGPVFSRSSPLLFIAQFSPTHPPAFRLSTCIPHLQLISLQTPHYSPDEMGRCLSFSLSHLGAPSEWTHQELYEPSLKPAVFNFHTCFIRALKNVCRWRVQRFHFFFCFFDFFVTPPWARLLPFLSLSKCVALYSKGHVGAKWDKTEWQVEIKRIFMGYISTHSVLHLCFHFPSERQNQVFLGDFLRITCAAAIDLILQILPFLDFNPTTQLVRHMTSEQKNRWLSTKKISDKLERNQAWIYPSAHSYCVRLRLLRTILLLFLTPHLLQKVGWGPREECDGRMLMHTCVKKRVKSLSSWRRLCGAYVKMLISICKSWQHSNQSKSFQHADFWMLFTSRWGWKHQCFSWKLTNEVKSITKDCNESSRPNLWGQEELFICVSSSPSS